MGFYVCYFVFEYWFWYFFNFISHFVMYVSFVFYLPENDQVIGRNMYEIIVYII